MVIHFISLRCITFNKTALLHIHIVRIVQTSGCVFGSK